MARVRPRRHQRGARDPVNGNGPVRLGVVGCGHATAAPSPGAPSGRRDRGRGRSATWTQPARPRSQRRSACAPPTTSTRCSLSTSTPSRSACHRPTTPASPAPVLAGGRHLFLEKPPTPTLEELDRLISATDDANVVALVGFNLRHHQNVVAARRIVASGTLGAIEVVRSTFTSGHPLHGRSPVLACAGPARGGDRGRRDPSRRPLASSASSRDRRDPRDGGDRRARRAVRRGDRHPVERRRGARWLLAGGRRAERAGARRSVGPARPVDVSVRRRRAHR